MSHGELAYFTVYVTVPTDEGLYKEKRRVLELMAMPNVPYRAPGHSVPSSNPCPKPALKAQVKGFRGRGNRQVGGSLRVEKRFSGFYLIARGSALSMYMRNTAMPAPATMSPINLSQT